MSSHGGDWNAPAEASHDNNSGPLLARCTFRCCESCASVPVSLKLQVGGGYAFYNMGLLKATAQKASVLALWAFVLGPLWVALFLGECPSSLVLIGFTIILLGVL